MCRLRASIGLTERDARAKSEGLKFTVGKYPFKSHGKAIASLPPRNTL